MSATRRTAFVTGANGGIGSVLAAEFRAAGWDVIGTDVRAGAEDARLNVRRIDASDHAALAVLAGELRAAGTRIDCLVNNAAVQIAKTLLETEPDEWEWTLRSNVGAVHATARALVPLMPAGSTIVNVSSVHARATSIGIAAYATSKGAVSALTRAMALELAPRGIRVNAVLPGAIETPMLTAGLERGGNAEASRDQLVGATPLKRVGDPKDISAIILFLAGPGAENITGQEFVCDGGVLARLASE